MRHPASPCARYLRASRALSLGVGFLLAACGTGTPPDAGTIPKETFVATYVDLRLAVLDDAAPTHLSDSAKASILARHGVTEDDLLTFVKVHGADPAFMQSVWSDVQERISATRPDAGPDAKSPPRLDSAPVPDRQRRPDGQGLPPTER